jgi:phosphatidylinositol-4,5-bisphosphate 3-kinase catalytic subunit alpha/beta/delta
MVKGIKGDKCKVMKSKKRPMWLAFESIDNEIEYIMFKKGDDLRQDILTIQLFKIMQNLWFENGLRLKMSLYSVVSTGYFQGMLEMVKNSETLATVHKLYGGATAAFSREPLKKWFEANVSLGETEYVHNFKLSCAAYCISTFVLGIGDRHNDKMGSYFI